MSDVNPNYQLEAQGLQLERAQLLLNIQSQEYRIAQTNDEIQRTKANIEATQKAVQEIDKKISNLTIK